MKFYPNQKDHVCEVDYFYAFYDVFLALHVKLMNNSDMLRFYLFILPAILLSEPNVLWFEEFSGSGEESIGHFILACEDNGFLQVGETYDYTNLSSKILVVKINASGQLLWSREIFSGEHNLGNSAMVKQYLSKLLTMVELMRLKMSP